MQHRARIIATIGPASSSMNGLESLYHAGVTVFRLNMSHGTHDEHRQVIDRIRSLKIKSGCLPAILMDLQGPKIRVGELAEPVHLLTGKTITLAAHAGRQYTGLIPTTYKNLCKDVRPKDIILLDDGAIRLRVERVQDGLVRCRVLHGGLLKSHKGINLPGVRVSAPSLTVKDQEDLLFGIRAKVDYIALSFVRKASDVCGLKSLLKRRKADIPVIAKIEKPEALNDLDGILNAADGVMVARGDLGVEMSVEKVPIAQKQIIRSANSKGKLVITATQMLESMLEHPYPTRAEASDVANAIFDGTDAVMLSGETALGKFPLQAVRTMASIAQSAEQSPFHFTTSGNLDARPGFLPHTIAEAAYHAGCEIGHSALVVFTLSGATAIYLSKLRPCVPIISLTPHDAVCRRLALAWGIQSLVTPFGCNVDEMIDQGEKALLSSGLLKRGQTIVVLAGTNHFRGGTNMIKVHRLR